MSEPKEPEVLEAETAEPDYKALYEQAHADAEKWKALSRQNEGRAKANADAASELEDLSKTLAAIEGENAALKAQAERNALVAKVASETGVPESIVATLAADEEDALTAAATAIAEAFKTPGGAPAGVPEAGAFPRGTGAKTKAQQFGEAFDQLLGR